MPKRLKLNEGDVFSFAVGEDKVGIGQIAEFSQPSGRVFKGVFLVSILEPLFESAVELDEIDLSAILLSGWTMDARLYHGNWTVIGNRPVPVEKIPKPCSKVTIEGAVWVNDYRGNPVRRATPQEAEALDLHSSRSPMGFESAFLAHHGFAEPSEHHRKLTLNYRMAHERLCRL